ncbi:lipopolysaccharide-induced tumor necrosis factor-alpha factor homolog isoform X3 [Drosophila sulfurigaster albostrigata]|uniref:lipopolysaccharide-induced tumor necrosis factor-alpha factor homolog isoform X3 n=1 Tax=Drosophila sulfurigaster albostrigata TaxID=89887 RepID=UPI002D21B2DE|nr:lipopolysaccharide-induced tumor necrosis factor-alpha factor homolog isoform X3 [Drosophila sulfurigaster albostrigata]
MRHARLIVLLGFYASSSATTMSSPVGPTPANVVCPNCRQQVTTRTEPKATNKTHLIALLMCCCFCWICAPFLYCTDCARNTDHYCPSCQTFIGSYER